MHTHLFLDYRVVKDPVHTSIELPASFFAVIDDPLFQRLRNIKQTGLTHYVYPGLRHTRFEHSLGVAHLMLTSLEAIARNTISVYGDGDEASTIARRLLEPLYWCAAGLAALLHDIGHMTWSHVFETALRDLSIVSLATGATPPSSVTNHEGFTLILAHHLLSKHSEGICGFTGRDATTLLDYTIGILDLAYGGGSAVEDEELRKTLYVPARLLSGTIDVDRGDYLLRDSRSAGVSYGLYDLDRLIRVLVLAPRGDGLYDIGVVDKGVSVVENMLLGRMYMYSEVYMHDVVLAYEASAARLLSLLLIAAWLGYENDYPGLGGLEKRILECLWRLVSEATTLPQEHPEVLEECARLATDPPVETIVETLASGDSDIYEMLRRLKWSDWICPALRIYSRVLTTRKHPATLYLEGSEATLLLRKLGKEDFRVRVPKLLGSYIKAIAEEPLIVMTYINPRIYDEVLVVKRETKLAYRLEETRASTITSVLRKERGKVAIALPYTSKPPLASPLRLRRGKLDEKLVMDAYRACGYSEEEAYKRLRKHEEFVDALLVDIMRVIRA